MLTPSYDRARRFRRRTATLLAALYALLSVGAPLAHATATSDQPPVAHIEGTSERACPPAHDGLHCQSCQTARLVAPCETHGPVVAVALPSPVREQSVAATPHELAHAGPHAPRAPPCS